MGTRTLIALIVAYILFVIVSTSTGAVDRPEVRIVAPAFPLILLVIGAVRARSIR